MSKAEYFKELHYRLRGLPERERQNILSVYEELFQKALENGKDEEDVAASLGYPRVPNMDAMRSAQHTQTGREHAFENTETARPHRNPEPPHFQEPVRHQSAYAEPEPSPANYSQPYANPYPYKGKNESGFKPIIVSIALGLFNLIFVLGPFFGLFGALIGLFVTGIALLIAPIVAVAGSFASYAGADLRLIFFAGLTLFGLGILLTVFIGWLLKWFFKLTWMYIQFNAKLIRGV